MAENMVSLSRSDGYLESFAQEAKKNDTAFMDIIKELLDVEEGKCIKRYESIRTTFSRYVRKALGKSGTAREEIHLDPKYEHLRWLATFIKTRATSGNVQLVREEEQTNSDNGDSKEEEDKFPSQESSPSR